MGRAKSDPPESFPWEKYFSSDSDLYDSANDQCQTTTSAEMVRKVLTVLGISFSGGDKISNCLKISKEISMIKKKISKIQDSNIRSEMTSKVASYFRSKFLDKIYPDRKIQVPPKPDLPRLTDDEIKEINQKFDKLLGEAMKTRASSPSRISSSSLSSSSLQSSGLRAPAPDEKTYIFDTSNSNEDKILEAAMILYYSQVPTINNKKSLTKDGAITVVKNLFKNKSIKPTSKLLDSVEIVKVLMKVAAQVKESKKEIPSDIIVFAKSVLKEAIDSLPNISSVESEEKVPVSLKPVAIPTITQKRKYSKEDFIRVIKSKGWEVPTDDSSESLCDYILDQIQQEEPKYVAYQQQLQNKILELEVKITSLVQQQDAKIIELEELKAMNNFNLETLEKKEKEIKSLEKKIQKLENELISTKEKQQEVELVKEDNKQVCFAMNDWLNQDSFDISTAESSMSCSDEKYPICNIDQQRCTDSNDAHSYSEQSFKITSSNKNKIDSIESKLKKQRSPPAIPEQPIVQAVVEEVKPKKKITSENISEFIKNKLTMNLPSKIDDVVVNELIQEFIQENNLKQDFVTKYKSAFTKLSLQAFEQLKPVVVEPSKQEIKEKIMEIVSEQNIKTLIGDLDDVVASLQSYLEEIFNYDLSSKKQMIFEILEESVRNNITDDELGSYIVEFINSNQTRKFKKQDFSYMLEFLQQSFNVNFEPRSDEISELYKQLIEQYKKPSSMKSCSTKDNYSSFDEARQDLECPDGEVCDLVKGVCRIAEEDDIVEEIMVDDIAIKVIGSENIINTLKEKIISSQVEISASPLEEEQPVVDLSNEVQTSIPEVIQEEIIEPEVSLEIEEKVPEPMPTVKVETPSLEDIVKNIKEITTEKKSVTTTQQKLKVAQQKAIERLRKCAGL